MTHRRLPLLLMTGALLAAGGTAAADEAGGADRAYALVVGSNAPGEGQEALRWAERDAERMAEVLRDLAGYGGDRIEVLTGPTPEALLGALDGFSARLAGDAAAGRRSVFFFYYSGHARSKALDLGPRQLSLEALRERVLSLPTTLTIVVLDACQSGAFSRVKGAEPAADFSFNSISGFGAEGVAVMASSTGTELSQESERLRSSYFTHYLLVGLRGAGDGNNDGRVSLDEAYRYAYTATLATTARTSVGGQHVTLETDLRGKGEVPLTYPARADAQLELPAELTATVLVQIEHHGAVMAEVEKSAGKAVRLALPAGDYLALVRTGSTAVECRVGLDRGAVTRLPSAACREVALEDTVAKGGGYAGPRYGIEVGLGLTGTDGDAYTETLRDFGFGEDSFLTPALSVAGTYRMTRNLHLGGEVGSLEAATWSRRGDPLDQQFDWHVFGLGGFARGVLPTSSEKHALFAQVGGGLARGRTRYSDTLGDGMPDTEGEVHWGYHLGASAGGYVTPIANISLLARVRYDYAPVIDNLIGDTHDSGGLAAGAGVRVSF